VKEGESKSRYTCPGEGDGPRNLPQAFSVGADLSTEEVRASDAGESGRGK
jgi:hypothetical protein